MDLKRDKMRQKRKRSEAKKLRDQSILEMKIAGKTNAEIARKAGLSYCQVSRVLNGQEVRELVSQGESRFTLMMEKALNKVETALDQDGDLPSGLKAAITVLKSLGIVKERVDLTHTFPKPTVVEFPGGGGVVLGAEREPGERRER